jgi:uncharacterized membrane protein (UPF0127 family)
MLFVFPEDGRYSFWMKDMTYAIDVLWLSKEGQIVYAIPGLAPESYPKTFTSDTPARYVLELRAGFMDLHNVSVGDFVSL